MRVARSERAIYLRVLTPLLLAVVTLVIVSLGGFHLLSGARAYVGGESLWSKATSGTVARLRAHLTDTAARRECEPLSDWLAVPLGDRAARLALDRPDPELEVARAGFIRGGNAPDDTAAMIRLYRYFGDSPLMRDSVAAWQRGDALVERLRELGDRICAGPVGGGATEARATQLAELDGLDAELRVQEARFSASLGASSRRAEELLAWSVVLLAALLVGGGLWIAWRSLRTQMERRRALADSNDRWALAADAAGIGVFMWRLDDDTFEFDARSRAIYGLPETTPAVMPRAVLTARVHPDERGFAVKAAQSAAEGEPLHVRYHIVRDDGAVRHLEAAGLLRERPAPIGRRLFGVVRDITDEVERTQLAHERDAAERVARARTEFMSRLSHELRTPLNAVLGMAQLLEGDDKEPLGPKQRHRVELILQSGWHLLRLVDDVLDVTSIDAGVVAVKPTAIELRRVLRAALALVEPQRASTEVVFVDEWPAEPARVMADGQRLQQVLSNLIGNACKYNRRGGRVTLGYRDAPAEVGLTITDEGRGIAPADLAELFQPFKRLAATSDVPGTGLGLVIVKLLVEQMGGRIDVSSEPDQGACFSVWLPKA